MATNSSSYVFDRDTEAQGFQTPRDIYKFESIFGPRGPNIRLTPQTPEEVEAYNRNRQNMINQGLLDPGDIAPIDPETKFDVPEDTETSKKIDDFVMNVVGPVVAKTAGAVIPGVGTLFSLTKAAPKVIDFVDRNILGRSQVDNRATQPGDRSWGSGGTGSSGDSGPSSVDTPSGPSNSAGPDVTGGHGVPNVDVSPLGEVDAYSPPSTDMGDQGNPGESGWGFKEGGKVPFEEEKTVKKTTVVYDEKGNTQQVQKDVIKGPNKESFIAKKTPPKKPSLATPKMADGGVVPMPQMIADPNAAPPQAMADDVPMEAKEGDFILNMDAVNMAGLRDIKKMLKDALEEATIDGKQIVPPDSAPGREVDIFVHNGEVHIPAELVKYIGEDKLSKMNNRGLKKRAEREKAQGAEQSVQQLPQNIAAYQGMAQGGEVAAPFSVRNPQSMSPLRKSSGGSLEPNNRNPRGYFLRRKKQRLA